jgi:hypothetical protein
VAITVKQNQPNVAFRGHLSAERFQEWFKSDYGAGGERIEIPKNATLLGTLVITDGDEILMMPFYTWGDGNHKHFSCQGFTFGKAPAFSVAADTETEFLQRMKKRLESLN